MMRLLLNLFFVCMLWFLYSCGIPRHIRKAYTGCYKNIPTGIDTLLDLSGCFSVNYLAPFRNEGMGTIYCIVMFYDDGIAVRTETISTSTPIDDFSECMQREINQIYTDPIEYKYYREGRGMYRWGIYELNGDTIKVQFINRPYPPEKYSSYIVMYKVIDRHTIQEISNKEVLPPKESEPSYRVKPFLYKLYHFIPIEKLPSSDCWLKRKKWFWCDEEQYRKYQHQNTKKECLYNSNPNVEEGQGAYEDANDPNALSRRGIPNKHRKTAWKDGQTYFSPGYIGYRRGGNVLRLGYSHEFFQDITQNWVHRNGFPGLGWLG